MIDQDRLLDRVAGKVSLLRKMLARFNESLPGRLAALRQAVEAQDSEALRQTAHSLKGSAANFEYPPVVEAARELEMMGLEGRWEGAEECHDRLSRELEAMDQALDALLSGLD